MKRIGKRKGEIKVKKIWDGDFEHYRQKDG